MKLAYELHNCEVFTFRIRVLIILLTVAFVELTSSHLNGRQGEYRLLPLPCLLDAECQNARLRNPSDSGRAGTTVIHGIDTGVSTQTARQLIATWLTLFPQKCD